MSTFYALHRYLKELHASFDRNLASGKDGDGRICMACKQANNYWRELRSSQVRFSQYLVRDAEVVNIFDLHLDLLQP